ncbi:MAG: right-handed parallel beta-helix repeat-containing protein [Acidobacteria bacterium]|nr:right-handed parallel beta-helix repeat-containing protein [Acidobacteriota bacterium]
MTCRKFWRKRYPALVIGFLRRPSSLWRPSFAGAISKTFINGEIDCLDPGGFGTLTITKSITVDGGATFASALASGAVAGFTINIAPNVNDPLATVRLKRLSINGTGASGAVGTSTGQNGIRFIQGTALFVDNCMIDGFTTDGIAITTAAASQLFVKDTTITNCAGNGINVAATAAAASAIAIDHVQLVKNGTGVRVINHARVIIRNSILSTSNVLGSSGGVVASSSSSDVQVDVDSCQVTFNSLGLQAQAGATIRSSNSYITGNGTGISLSGGSVLSFGDNRVAGNTAGQVFSGAVIQQL